MKKSLFVFLFGAVVVFGMLSPGYCEIGVSDTEIHIGQWGPQSGPAAAWGAVARGTDAYFKWINANGGIHGRKLVHHYFDDGYNPARTIAGVKQLQEQRGMFAWVGGVGTAPGLAVKQYLMGKKIPWIGPAAGSWHWVTPPEKYLFNVYPLYLGDAQLLVEYAVKKMEKKSIAIVYQEDDYGEQGLAGTKYMLEKYNMELAAAVPVALGDSDMRPHAMRLSRSKADAVLLFISPVAASRIIGIGKAMNYAPQWMSSSTCGDCPLMIEITQGLYEGVITSSFGMLDAGEKVGDLQHINNPRHKLVAKYKTEVYEKFAARDERWGYTFLVGVGLAEPFVEAIKRAGRDLTRERLLEELEKMEKFQGVFGRITYGPFDPNDPLTRIGQQELFLHQCTADGGSRLLTDWIETEYIPMDH
jgi:branched-chain amino acid transport system substrate-binding protein